MKEYFTLIPLELHILILVYSYIHYNSDKYINQRVNPTVESPLSWQIKQPSIFEKSFAIYEGIFSTLLIIITCLFMGYKVKWYYAIFLYLEIIIIAGLFIGILNGLIMRLFKTNLFAIQKFCNNTRFLTIFIDIYLFYNLFKIISNY
ncbi:hypothetical protein [Soonwooa purpurea]